MLQSADESQDVSDRATPAAPAQFASVPNNRIESASSNQAEAARRPPKKLGTAILNLMLDIVLAIMVCWIIWVSTMLQVAFPAATAAKGWTLWGWTFDQWRNAQFVSLCVVFVLILEHIVLHWTWICGIINTKVLRLKSRPDEAVQKVYGIGLFFGVAILGFIALIAAVLSIHQPK